MDIAILLLGAVLLFVGVIGCFLPILPGPPLAFCALLVQQLKSQPPFSFNFILLWGLIVIIVFLLDYIIPPLTTRRFWGSRTGVIGSTIGLILGLIFFPPFGLIIGAFLGAFIGEIIGGKERNLAMKSSLGALIGFLTGSLLKLSVVVVMIYYFITSIG